MTQQSKIPANRINVEELQQSLGGGLELGDIGIAPFGIDETKNTRRYLNGQVISQIQFEAFTSLLKEKVLTYTNLSTTEENWQAEVTNSKLGQCGKFVIDDEAGTIRLPKVVNINGLQDLTLMGGIKAESLPNITGFVGTAYNSFGGSDATVSGAFKKSTSPAFATGSGPDVGFYGADFDASLSSSTYQDNAPVQQEAIQYPYFIQVANGSEEAGNITTEIQLNNPFSLLDYKWSEYEITNASWLISNGTFHSGATYISVYELLQKIYNRTEAKDGVSVKLSTEEYTDYDFVLNTAESTFRLPVKVLLASGMRITGNGMTLGLTDGTNNAGMYYLGNSVDTLTTRSELYGEDVGIGAPSTTASLAGSSRVGLTTDPTKSGIETSSQGLYLYFYVGETVQDANIISASQVLTKVANGIDRTSATDIETVVGWGVPDYSAGIGVSLPYTCPSFGFITVTYTSTRYTTDVFVNGVSTGSQGASNADVTNTSFLFCQKGDIISIGTNYAHSAKFFPLIGV